MPQRSCGDCQECCRVVHVVALDKPRNTVCEHQCPTGCAIYPDRPKECKQFRCSWLNGDMNEDMRPDNSGVIVEDMYWDDFTLHYPYDARPGACKEHDATLKRAFCKPKHIMFLHEGKDLAYVPEDLEAVETLAYMMANGMMRMVDCDGKQIV